MRNLLKTILTCFLFAFISSGSQAQARVRRCALRDDLEPAGRGSGLFAFVEPSIPARTRSSLFNCTHLLGPLPASLPRAGGDGPVFQRGSSAHRRVAGSSGQMGGGCDGVPKDTEERSPRCWHPLSLGAPLALEARS